MRSPLTLRWAVLLLPVATACADPEPKPTPKGDDTGTPTDDTGDVDTGPAPCGSAGDTLQDGLTELVWDSDTSTTHMDDQTWSVDGTEIRATTLNEGVRFELDHPAKIHGFAVQWGVIPDGDEATELVAGLYSDFGHNGFDYWVPDPLWEGTRCKGDIVEGDWTTYAFDGPVDVTHPGLVYVGHQRTGEGDKALLFDTVTVDPDGTCDQWDFCHSTLNMPEVLDDQYYNGTTFPFQYNFKVRLFVEYTDDVQDADKVFQQTATLDVDADGDGDLDSVPLSNRGAWGDYDNDGWDDLLSTSRLYHNNGDDTFTDVTSDSGVGTVSARSGGVWGDFDNDGDLDLFIFAESYSAGDSLLRNEGDGTFVDVTIEAGFDDTQTYEACEDADANTAAPTPGAAWVDIDGDGLLDLYLSNFICWSLGRYYMDNVYHNEGDGTFSDWTGLNGFSDAKRAGRGVAPADADGDGDVDLLVNNYRLHSNLFYDNLGDGTVEEIGRENDLAGDPTFVGSTRYYGHTIGVAWGDLDNDGDLDVVQSNLAHPRFFTFSNKTMIMMNDGAGEWVDNQGEWLVPEGDAGLRYQETHSVPVLADFDHDGNLDLSISAVYNGRPTDFYWGNGDGTFRLDAYHAGIFVENGWGMAASDYDNDGDPDLATQGVLFENSFDGGEGSWLQVRAVGNVDSNWAAIGATIRVTTEDGTRTRIVSGGNGQGGQDSLYVHFGLGESETVSHIDIDFPGGGNVSYDDGWGVGQRLWVYEDGTVTAGWAPAE
jgi:hypothetical protein